jgi:GT2 family glycosyltransferase
VKPCAIVILNWNGVSFLKHYLPVLKNRTSELLANIYVIDNDSSDDSVHFLREHYANVKLIQNKKNLGFAGGYNEGLKNIQEPILCLINSDIEVTDHWLEPILNHFNRYANVASIQPKILDLKDKKKFEYAGGSGGFYDHFGYAVCRGRYFDSVEEDKGQYDDVVDLFWASGCCIFVRNQVFKEVGGFDTDYFAHQEEIDLCWRLQLAGHRIMSCPASIIYHIGGGTLAKNNPKKIYLNFRNNLIMLWKNLEGIEAIITISFRFMLDAISAWKNLLSGQTYFFTAVVKAHFGFFSWLIAGQKKSIFPYQKIAKPAGRYMGSVVWQHFAKGKNRFSEIVEN